jgi:hypothetical protein
MHKLDSHDGGVGAWTDCHGHDLLKSQPLIRHRVSAADHPLSDISNLFAKLYQTQANGRNEIDLKVAMTTPVFTEPEGPE